MKIITDYLTEISKSIELIKKKLPDEDLVFSYRGESKDYGKTKLMPSLFRGMDKDICGFERKLIESLSDYNISSNNNSILKMMIDSQHYIAKSRLLDVTFNALVALFFALDGANKDDKNAVIYVIGMPKKFVFSPNSIYLNKYYERVIEDEVENEFLDNLKLITFSMGNERIIAQDGGFILFPGNRYKEFPEIYFHSFSIEIEKKEMYMKLLNDIFNVTISKIYPEKSYKGQKIGIDILNREYHNPKNELIELELYRYRKLLELKYYKKDKKKSEMEFLRIKRAYIQDFNRLKEKIKDKNEFKELEIDEITKKFLDESGII
ncbi:FRG domain-containing protein [Clostridium sp. UBA1652]|uniref:FRG domain-containing protein n=1 Tax=Clostridium sp. UBA1652 TaxID=1946348 RepID=UPI002580A7BA|nr:FRG domain-containing protein [Clostridium sp. UBA1652]